MAYEPKDNSGSMFVNDKKESDKHPDRKGSAIVGGVEYWVSGWLKTSDKGVKWLSLSFQPKEQAAPARPAPNKYAQQRGQSGYDDEPPF